MNWKPSLMMGRSWRDPMGTAIWLCLVLTVPAMGQAGNGVAEPAAVAAVDSLPEVPSQIRLVAYRASAFAYRVFGTLLWLDGPEDLRRLEIRQGHAPNALAALLNQQGQGWTLVLGGAGSGTLNGWGEGWHAPPPGLQRAVGAIGAALQEGAPVLGAEIDRWRSLPAATRPGYCQVRPLSDRSPAQREVAGFRHRLGRRGLGRGGEDEVLSLDWVVGPSGGESWLRVRSSRRPGQLELATIEEVAVVYAMPEAFVPLWPLNQLIEIIRKP